MKKFICALQIGLAFLFVPILNGLAANIQMQVHVSIDYTTDTVTVSGSGCDTADWVNLVVENPDLRMEQIMTGNVENGAFSLSYVMQNPLEGQIYHAIVKVDGAEAKRELSFLYRPSDASAPLILNAEQASSFPGIQTQQWFQFTAPETGAYVFYLTSGTASAYLYASDNLQSALATTSMDNTLSATLQAGQSYRVKIVREGVADYRFVLISPKCCLTRLTLDGNVRQFVTAATDVADISSVTTFCLRYDPEQLELADLDTATNVQNVAVGIYDNIQVTGITDSSITFRYVNLPSTGTVGHGFAFDVIGSGSTNIFLER